MPGFEISNNEAEQRNMEPQVKTEGKLKQRDSVTDILFNIAVEHVIWKETLKQNGILNTRDGVYGRVKNR